MKIYIYILYNTGNPFEPTDNITEVIYLPPYYMTSEIIKEVRKFVNISFGLDSIISYTWEVSNE